MDINVYIMLRYFVKTCVLFDYLLYVKKSLKILNGQQEVVGRRTNNTMASRKKTNKELQNTTQKTNQESLKIPKGGNQNPYIE